MVDALLKSDWQSVDGQSLPREESTRAVVDRWAETTRQMVAGDQAAFAEYYETFFELMLRESERCTGRDQQTCLDIVQDAMLKAIRGMKPIANETELRRWTRCVVKSVAYDWLRRENRHSKAVARLADTALATTQVSDADVDGDTTARLLWLDEQLRQLDPELRRVIRRRYRFGWTLRRIGERMGLKPGAVDGRIRRAVDALKLRAENQHE
jgi:RNA polymerase sigma factor (sigma-70 family)